MGDPGSDHLGRAPFHCIADTETSRAEFPAKPEGKHGQRAFVRALLERKVETILCKGIGYSAAMTFVEAGIPVMRALAGTVADALDAFKPHELTHLSEADLCGARSKLVGLSPPAKPDRLLAKKLAR